MVLKVSSFPATITVNLGRQKLTLKKFKLGALIS